MSIEMTTPTLSWTVNDVLRCFPISMLVLNKLGIDTCCGARATLQAAAEKISMAPEDLLAALLPCTGDDEVMPTTDGSGESTSCRTH